MADSHTKVSNLFDSGTNVHRTLLNKDLRNTRTTNWAVRLEEGATAGTSNWLDAITRECSEQGGSGKYHAKKMLSIGTIRRDGGDFVAFGSTES